MFVATSIGRCWLRVATTGIFRHGVHIKEFEQVFVAAVDTRVIVAVVVVVLAVHRLDLSFQKETLVGIVGSTSTAISRIGVEATEQVGKTSVVWSVVIVSSGGVISRASSDSIAASVVERSTGQELLHHVSIELIALDELLDVRHAQSLLDLLLLLLLHLLLQELLLLARIGTLLLLLLLLLKQDLLLNLGWQLVERENLRWLLLRISIAAILLLLLPLKLLLKLLELFGIGVPHHVGWHGNLREHHVGSGTVAAGGSTARCAGSAAHLVLLLLLL